MDCIELYKDATHFVNEIMKTVSYPSVLKNSSRLTFM